jgi:hypothetical protein
VATRATGCDLREVRHRVARRGRRLHRRDQTKFASAWCAPTPLLGRADLFSAFAVSFEIAPTHAPLFNLD